MCLKLWALSKNPLSLFTTEQQNIVLYGKKVFLWKSSILGKLGCFCLTCVLFPLVRSAEHSFRSIQSNNNVYIICLFHQISHSYQGDVAQIQQQILQGRLYSFKSYMHTVYHMFKQCLIVVGFKDAHSSNYNIFPEESCLHQRVLFSKYGSLFWKNITVCIQKKCVQLWRSFLNAYIYHVFFI